MRTPVMRLLAAVSVVALISGTAWAQQLENRVSMQSLGPAFTFVDYVAEDSPSDESAPVAPTEADSVIKEEGCAPALDRGKNGRGKKCCDAKGCGKACCGGPWTLPQPCVLQNMGIKMGGWLQQGITFNGNNPANGINGPVATNDWDGEYQMNQLWLFLDKQADTGGCGTAIGGHIDMLYGTDWRFGVNHGLENRINGFDFQSYGMVIPQMYMEVAVNDLSVKLGHFAGLMDYEVIPAPMNPFYSHSYSYGYTVDQLTTGVLGDYKVSDQWSVLAGITQGWFMFEDLNDHMDFISGLRWDSPDKRTSFAYSVTIGPQDPAGVQDRFASSLVMKRQITDQFQYVLVHNLGVEDDATVDNRDGEWYGINQYFLYQVNPEWSLNARFEWLRDDDGTRVMGPGALGVLMPGIYPDVRAFDGMGFAGDFYELTLGANWRPHSNLLIRPECRWDWYNGQDGQFVRSGTTGQPFNDGNSSDQFTFGVDMIITY